MKKSELVEEVAVELYFEDKYYDGNGKAFVDIPQEERDYYIRMADVALAAIETWANVEIHDE